MVVLGVAAILVLSSKPENSLQASNLSAEISVDEAYQLYRQGVFFLDVRTEDEWDAYHIAGSTLIPLEQLTARLDELPRDQTIVVVCRSGNRSRSGRGILLEAGFTQITSVSGGLTAWSNAGYPLEGSSP